MFENAHILYKKGKIFKYNWIIIFNKIINININLNSKKYIFNGGNYALYFSKIEHCVISQKSESIA